MRADKDIKVFKVEHSIYFANCKIFADNIYKLNQLKPSQHHVQPSVLHQKDKSAANDTANETEDYDELNRTNNNQTNLNHELPSSSSPSPAHDGPELIVRRASLVSRDQNHIQSPADTSLMISHDFILDFSAVNYIDTNGIQVVEELIDDFKNIGVFVYICRPQESFLRMICRLKLVDKFDSHVFLTVEDAIRHFNEKTV